jgi:hypothetical protein
MKDRDRFSCLAYNFSTFTAENTRDLSLASLAALAAAYLTEVRVFGSAPKAEVCKKTPGTGSSKTQCNFKNNNECNAMNFEN